jgi:hypothetical protein
MRHFCSSWSGSTCSVTSDLLLAHFYRYLRLNLNCTTVQLSFSEALFDQVVLGPNMNASGNPQGGSDVRKRPSEKRKLQNRAAQRKYRKPILPHMWNLRLNSIRREAEN